MFTKTLDTPIIKTRKIDARRRKALKKLGLSTIKDLIFYFPKRYDDFSTISLIKNLKINEKATVRGTVLTINNSQTFRKKFNITEAIIADETSSIKVIWFNQPYIKNYLNPGTYATFHGKIEQSYPAGLQITSPAYEKFKKDSMHTGRIVPIYSETAYLTSKWLRFIIKPLLKYTINLKDWLPAEIKKRQNLIDLKEALYQIHFPKNLKFLSQARKRLAFDELFLIQLDALTKKYKWQNNISYKINFDKDLVQKFLGTLSFKLTSAQKISAWEILKDLEKEKPMNRLLEGDVGSGKTLVAAIAILQTISDSFQAALMAPTEILAKQHFESFIRLFRPYNFRIGLITRNNRLIFDPKLKKKIINTSKDKIIKKTNDGSLNLVIGTHALIQDNIKFNKMALAVIDEQHRFGVKQRAQLKKIDSMPKISSHLLSMTATPIPRTLALGIYGDLDLSLIDEMPPGRQKIITKLVAPHHRKKAYSFIKNLIAKGRQIFVVCPLIEESDKLGVRSAIAEHKKLSKIIFPEFEIGLLHGKLKNEEKDKTMQDFISGNIDILVSTSVIEVGIDVPNATIMMIEGAERFGLSQLHQFRGRVGRGKYQSYCFLFTDSHSENALKRLKALLDCHNGFKLAEIDLELRGPGEIYGIKQSGLADLQMASLTDYDLIKKTRLEAAKIIMKDPQINNFPELRKKLKELSSTIHFE